MGGVVEHTSMWGEGREGAHYFPLKDPFNFRRLKKTVHVKTI